MCDVCALRCKTCWKRIVLVTLTCLAAVSQSAILLKHPECRPNTNCRRSDLSVSENKFIYYVNKTGAEEEQQVLIKYDGREMSFLICCNCNQDFSGMAADDPALPGMTSLTSVKEVKFQGCIVPNISYASVLAALNITFSSDSKDGVLCLNELPAEPRLQGHHMKGLSIKQLLITAANCDEPTRPKSDFLDHLPELKKLDLRGCVQPEKEAITHLPESLEILSLLKTQLAVDHISQNGSFWLKRLSSLHSLTLGEAEEIPEGLVFTPPPLSLLQNLTKLVLFQVPLSKLSDNTTWLKGSKLQSLELQYCDIMELPNGLFEGAEIAKIILDNNNLETLNEAFAPLQSSLKYLDVSNNMLNANALINALMPLKKLETLKVSNNPLNSLCDSGGDIQTNTPMSSKLPQSLRHLDLQNTSTTRICYDWIEHDSLMYLNLDENKIESLSYSDLKMRRVKNETVTLSLKKNPLLRIQNLNQEHCKNCINESSSKHVEGDEYRRVQVNLQLDLFICDCNAYWFREMLHHCPSLLKSDDVTCLMKFGETSLFDVHTQNLTCDYLGKCPPDCFCNKRPIDNATVVRCRGVLPQASDWPPAEQEYPLALHVAPGMLYRVPRIKLVELHAPFNNIFNLEESDIPDTLRVLDVRNNNITHITSGVARQLYRLSLTKDYNVSLSGNPLTCGCEDETAIATLQHAKIWDWNTTQCADHQYIIGKKKLCPDIMLLTLLTVTGALLIVTLIAIILLYLRPRIRQFFFDHNCCLQCFFSFEDDDDPLKTHDVFISYSFHDRKYAKTLIKKLEDHGHSTIEHCRDWLPGRTISQQITDSVLSARRTLLLVSDNFANSQWGLEEFHAAHAHAMERGSACVIVIRCNLLAPEKLPDNLRLYLVHNTYLDWSDRYFWKKLLKVMPMPQVSQQVPAISMLQDNMVQSSAGIKFASPVTAASGLALSRVSLGKELPLSELVLVPPMQQHEPGSEQLSGEASPVTPVVREPPHTGENKSSLPLNTQREPITALRMPAVA